MTAVAVIKDGEDKYCNHPSVIIADDEHALSLKVGAWLRDNIDIEKIVAAEYVFTPAELQAWRNASPDSDDLTLSDENTADAIREEDTFPTDEQVERFKATADLSNFEDWYDEHVCADSSPWEVYQITRADIID